MVVRLIKAGLLILVLAELSGCAPKIRRTQVNPNLTPIEFRQGKYGEPVWMMQVLTANQAEKLTLKPDTFPNGVYVCALENLSRPCLPKLSAMVAELLSQKGIVIETDQSKADATLYFETWFESFSSSTDMKKWVTTNPTVTGKNFAVKIEKSLETGYPPDIHKRFRDAPDPFTSVAVNANDDQKFIYAAFTVIEMDDVIDYPGDAEKRLSPSKNPWMKPFNKKKRSWFKPQKRVPPTRTLIGNYTGEIPTEMAVTPLLKDAINVLTERMTDASQNKKL